MAHLMLCVKIENLRTLLKRPIDCSSALIEIFVELLETSSEVPRDNLVQAFPGIEVLFLVGMENTTMGVSALRYDNANTHRGSLGNVSLL